MRPRSPSACTCVRPIGPPQRFPCPTATSFAAVPYTFDLLDRVGFADKNLPSLRYITQAGGRMEPERVRSYAQLGRRRGWDLFVMYGQTEATARMGYLPPDLAAEHPQAIGIPIPGGRFRLAPVPGLDACELVYTGPNVVLGYAESPEDLALGRTVTELRTGDLARCTADGLYEIVGRRSRFVKIVGLRVDLGQVERILSGLGVSAAAAGSDGKVVAAVEGGHDLPLMAKTLAQELGIPRGAVQLHRVTTIPRLGNGKPDYPAILALAAGEEHRDAVRADDPDAPAASSDVRRIFADVLERDDIGDTDTFVSLGGDSLSYVAASVRLERAFGDLPREWHVMPVCELARAGDVRSQPDGPLPGNAATPVAAVLRKWRRRLLAPMETGIVLRAVAIIFIVSTHIGWFTWEGMAHVLLAVAGFNFARFQLSGAPIARLGRQLRTVARIMVPSIAVIGFAFAVTDTYSWANVFLLNSVLGPEGWTNSSRFWFVEMLVHILLGVAALLSIPAVRRAQRRWPWVFPLALFGADLLLRFRVLDLPYPGQGPVLWLFALGWAAAVSRTLVQRTAVTVLALLTIPGAFDDEYRNATILAGFLILLWRPTVSVPRAPCPAPVHGPPGQRLALRLCDALARFSAIRARQQGRGRRGLPCGRHRLLGGGYASDGRRRALASDKSGRVPSPQSSLSRALMSASCAAGAVLSIVVPFRSSRLSRRERVGHGSAPIRSELCYYRSLCVRSGGR